MRLSRHFSPLVFVCVDFACTGQFRFQYVVRSVGSSVWDPVFNLPVFSFLESFCGPCGAATDFLFQLWFAAVLDVVVPSSTMSYACTSFLFFFPGACHYMRFVYLDGSSSIFGIRLLMQFSFSSVFRPVLSQRPSLVFLVRFFHA